MSYTVRSEGEYTFWTVEALSTYGGPKWDVASDYHLSRVPDEIRVGGRFGGADKEPFLSFSASGDVFLKTGNRGFTDPTLADQLHAILSSVIPTVRFRVVRVDLNLAREVVK